MTLPRAAARAHAGATGRATGRSTLRGRWIAGSSLALLWTGLACASRAQPDFAGSTRTQEQHTGKADTDPNTVEGEDVRDYPVYQVEQLLAGRVPGVQVIRGAGGGFSLRIRGINTLYGGTEPLYVVDGMPVQTIPGRGLDWLNPSDIETIEILKDASSLSQYGVRGANGVVVITTRRGPGAPR